MNQSNLFTIDASAVELLMNEFSWKPGAGGTYRPLRIYRAGSG